MISKKTHFWLKNQKCDKKGIPICVTREFSGIYSFEIFKPEINRLWVEEIENIRKFLSESGIPHDFPNPQNKNGVNLDDFGFYEILQTMIEKVVMPISRKLFWKIGENSLDDHFAFTTNYGENLDRKLDLHVDDSEVSINYCLDK